MCFCVTFCQKVPKMSKSWQKSSQKVVKKKSTSCQKVVKKLSKSCQKVVKKLSKVGHFMCDGKPFKKQVGAPTEPLAVIWKTCAVTNML
jgi:hypothetical protein